MTLEELLKIEHLKIAEVKPGMFVHIHAEDGYVITPWHEGQDIKNYSGSECMWMPIRENYQDTYRTITVEEHTEMDKKVRELIESELKNANNDRL